MKVFTCSNFKGHWPVGSAAVVVAKDKMSARLMLRKKLREMNLEQPTKFTLEEVDINTSSVIILVDGDY